jgi:ABC-type lipoprotein export system ATPase subunit
VKNINFHTKKGEFIAIIGMVGSGKSSFLNALIGEMESKYKGSVRYNGIFKIKKLCLSTNYNRQISICSIDCLANERYNQK